MEKRWNINTLWNHLRDSTPLRRHELKVVQAYQNCFTDKQGKLTDDGEIVLLDILQKGYVLTSSVAKSQINGMVDSNQVLVNEGKRSIAIQILASIKMDILETFNLKGQDNGESINTTNSKYNDGVNSFKSDDERI